MTKAIVRFWLFNAFCEERDSRKPHLNPDLIFREDDDGEWWCRHEDGVRAARPPSHFMSVGRRATGTAGFRSVSEVCASSTAHLAFARPGSERSSV